NGGRTYPLIIPPSSQQKHDEWVNIGQALMESVRTREIPPAVNYFASMASAYLEGQAAQFNEAVAGYRQWLQENAFAREVSKGRQEFFFNDTKAFLHAMIIYLCAFVLAGISLLTFATLPCFSESLRRSAFYLILLAGVVHTFGLVFRMYLEGRPPVTNLYSSAIFIGW